MVSLAFSALKCIFCLISHTYLSFFCKQEKCMHIFLFHVKYFVKNIIVHLVKLFFFYFSQTCLNSPFKTQCICCFIFLLLFSVLVNKMLSFRSPMYLLLYFFQKVLTSKLGQANKDLMLFC